MAPALDDEAIASFWAWFESVAARLGADFDNATLLDELDARVSALGDVTWEIGPGVREENALALSPDGDREGLALTERIVSMAPSIAGWELHAFRPARPGAAAYQFALRGDSGEEVDVDAGAWRYVLLRAPEEQFDIILEQPTLTTASEDDRYTAGIILLDGLLGERARLLHLRDVACVARLSPAHDAKASPVSALPAHLASLRGRVS